MPLSYLWNSVHIFVIKDVLSFYTFQPKYCSRKEAQFRYFILILYDTSFSLPSIYSHCPFLYIFLNISIICDTVSSSMCLSIQCVSLDIITLSQIIALHHWILSVFYYIYNQWLFVTNPQNLSLLIKTFLFCHFVGIYIYNHWIQKVNSENKLLFSSSEALLWIFYYCSTKPH